MPRGRRYFQRLAQGAAWSAALYAKNVYPKYDATDSTQCGGKHTRRWAGRTVSFTLSKQDFQRLAAQGLVCTGEMGWENIEFTIKRDTGQITLSEPPPLRVVR